MIFIYYWTIILSKYNTWIIKKIIIIIVGNISSSADSFSNSVDAEIKKLFPSKLKVKNYLKFSFTRRYFA